MPSAADYEAQRQKNILANQAILASLGLEKPAPAPTPKAKPKKQRKSLAGTSPRKPAVSKRKFEQIVAEGEDEDEGGKRRRSGRVSTRVDYTKEKIITSLDSDDEFLDDGEFIDDGSGLEDGVETAYKKSKTEGFLVGVKGGRTVRKFAKTVDRGRANGKYYGAPPVPVGTWWSMRSECARDDVHGPWVAGIHGDPQKGAYSIALSGGYEDDVDEGFRFTFTGEGGRDLKGTKAKPKNLRTAPQSKDQELTKGNAALMASCKNGKPVRVVRGFKGKNKWAPLTGYRYDGLYKVCKAWMEPGASGFQVYKFALKRLDGQPPIDLKAGPKAECEDEDEEDDDSASAKEDIESVADEEDPAVGQLHAEAESAEANAEIEAQVASNEVEEKYEVQAEEAEVQPEVVPEEVDEKPKRGRGRLRKSDVAPEAAAESVEEKPKRGRGRPRKSDA